mgnify:CR=1 FL=1
MFFRFCIVHLPFLKGFRPLISLYLFAIYLWQHFNPGLHNACDLYKQRRKLLSAKKNFGGSVSPVPEYTDPLRHSTYTHDRPCGAAFQAFLFSFFRIYRSKLFPYRPYRIRILIFRNSTECSSPQRHHRSFQGSASRPYYPDGQRPAEIFP